MSAHPNPDAGVEGRCLCGGIRFAIEFPTLFCAHCHCRWCRLAHGAAFVTWVGAAEARFRIIAGDDLLTWFHASVESRRGFCSRCGSTLFFASSVAPGEMHVTRASLPGPLDRAPTVHVFADEAVVWLNDAASLPHITGEHAALAHYTAIRPTVPE